MNKENILAWMQIIAGFIVLFIVVVTFQWFGSTTYVVLSAVLLAIGIGCTALAGVPRRAEEPEACLLPCCIGRRGTAFGATVCLRIG